MTDVHEEFPELHRFLASLRPEGAREMELDVLLTASLVPLRMEALDAISRESARALERLRVDPQLFTPQDLGCRRATPGWSTRRFLETLVERAEARRRAFLAYWKKELPELSKLLGGVFHQDADLEGLELDELVEQDVANCGPATLDPIISDIQRAFRHLDIDENAFTPQDLDCDQTTSDYATTRAFLEMILAKLEARKRAS